MTAPSPVIPRRTAAIAIFEGDTLTLWTYAPDLRFRAIGQLAELLGLTLGLRPQESPQTGHGLGSTKSLKVVALQYFSSEPPRGLEPRTYALRVLGNVVEMPENH